MNFKHLILSASAIIFLSFGLPKIIQKKVDKEISATFKVEMFSFEEKIISDEITKDLPSTFGEQNLFEIKVKDSLLGYAYISKAPSKTAEFDYLVLFDKELFVLKTKVLIYREEYGGEIGSRRWLKQFNGKSKADEVIFEENIVAISGATISVRSMTKAINNLLKSLKILHQKNII
ncbi:FMN-binding protein [Yeosuana sp. MJ-SS3]|uniref:FMN-binding protein n=1 Tax=Gilvirhabdus luticola TaxID=3079858 RepID=A0ABU3U4T3_9FLAO|nr:FMN-binding protein [Yeosuana sp. MJ-SS3]MDU8885414.1 FMN-binding protein [Yeosuana sp. MJ-SS3]